MGNAFASPDDDVTLVSSVSSEFTRSQSDALTKAEALRGKARQLQIKAKEASEQSQREYQSGNRSEAKLLSIRKSTLYNEMNEKRRQATELIFEHYNRDCSADVIDLHGLYVAEALEYLQRKVDDCRSKNILRLKVITGIGNHSENNIAKIKPKVENFARQNHLDLSLFDGHLFLTLKENKQYQKATNQNNDACVIL